MLNFKPDLPLISTDEPLTVHLILSHQLSMLVLKNDSSQSDKCTVLLKPKNEKISCKITGTFHGIITKLTHLLESVTDQEDLNMELVFSVASKCKPALIGNAIDRVILHLAIGLEVYKMEQDLINVCLRGRLNRLIKMFVGIFDISQKYGTPSKFCVADISEKSKCIGRVPGASIKMLKTKNKENQVKSGARIVYDGDAKNYLCVATITGTVLQVEQAIELICEQVKEQRESRKKKNANQSSPTAINPVEENESYNLMVPQTIVGRIFGKGWKNAKELEGTYQVKIKAENNEDGMCKITVCPKPDVESKPLEAMSKIFENVRAITYYRKKDGDGTNAKVNQQNKQQTFECSVCYSEMDLYNGSSCVDFERNNKKAAVHTFCNECIKQEAAVMSNPVAEKSLAYHGVGLRCMEPECKNALLMSTIRWFIDDKKVLEWLDNRCMESSLRAAIPENLVRCQECEARFIVEDVVSFMCPECNHRQCRLCDRPDHFPLSCEQVERREMGQESGLDQPQSSSGLFNYNFGQLRSNYRPVPDEPERDQRIAEQLQNLYADQRLAERLYQEELQQQHFNDAFNQQFAEQLYIEQEQQQLDRDFAEQLHREEQRQAEEQRRQIETERQRVEQAEAERQRVETEQRQRAEVERQRQAHLAEQRRQAQLAEQRRQAQLAEQQRQAQIAEQQRQAQLAEQQRQAQLAEQQRQAQIAEQQRQRNGDIERQQIFMRRLAIPCPSCKVPIEKKEGCNKMECVLCRTKFCYLCNKIISDYSHFGGRCELFPS